jgi:hypothetical protein
MKTNRLVISPAVAQREVEEAALLAIGQAYRDLQEWREVTGETWCRYVRISIGPYGQETVRLEQSYDLYKSRVMEETRSDLHSAIAAVLKKWGETYDT